MPSDRLDEGAGDDYGEEQAGTETEMLQVTIPNSTMPAGRRRLGIGCAVVLTNATIGVALAKGHTSLAVAVALAPVLAAVVTRVVTEHRDWIVFAALFLVLFGGPLDERLPGTAGTALYPADVLVALAIVGWFIARLTASSRETRPSWPRTIVLSWPLALLAIAIAIGVVRGHLHYGTSYVSQPVRIVIYAGIAGAVGGISPQVAHRRLTWVFYLGTVWQALLACYHLATGTSQTGAVDLSTGGARFVALSIAMYLAAALVLALLNLELLDKGGRKWIHFAVAGLATFVLVVAFGRTTFAALAVLLPLLFLALRKMRRTLLTYTPLLVPFLALAIVTMLTVAPSVGATLTSRLNLNQVAAGNDNAVITRQRKYSATLQGIGDKPVFGFGFGRPVEYTNPDQTISRINGDPENTYVYLLAGGGALALGAMILLIVSFFADAVRRLRHARGVESAVVIFAMALAFLIFVNTLSGPVLTQPDAILTMWIATLLPALVTRNRDNGSPRLG